MSQYSDNGRKTFQAGEALAAHRFVKPVAGTARDVIYADAAHYEEYIGATEYAVADNEQVDVRLLNSPGTFLCTASAAITVNEHIILAADGKVAPDGGTATEYTIGIALEAAAEDGDVIECYIWGLRILALN